MLAGSAWQLTAHVGQDMSMQSYLVLIQFLLAAPGVTCIARACPQQMPPRGVAASEP